MDSIIRRVLFAALGLASMASSDPAQAQTARKDGGNNAQLMQQMQQLAAERTQLSVENSRLKRELDETRKERDTLKGERETNDKKLRAVSSAAVRASGDRKQVEDELAKNKERMGDLVTKFRETVQTLREIETDRATTRQQLDTRNVELKSCVDRNTQLYTINDEILKRLDGQGFWTGVAKTEPFTRIKRTQLENLADDYRARAEDARVPVPAPAGAPVVPDHP